MAAVTLDTEVRLWTTLDDGRTWRAHGRMPLIDALHSVCADSDADNACASLEMRERYDDSVFAVTLG